MVKGGVEGPRLEVNNGCFPILELPDQAINFMKSNFFWNLSVSRRSSHTDQSSRLGI